MELATVTQKSCTCPVMHSVQLLRDKNCIDYSNKLHLRFHPLDLALSVSVCASLSFSFVSSCQNVSPSVVLISEKSLHLHPHTVHKEPKQEQELPYMVLLHRVLIKHHCHTWLLNPAHGPAHGPAHAPSVPTVSGRLRSRATAVENASGPGAVCILQLS